MEALFSNKDAGIIFVFISAGLTVVGSFLAHYWYKIRREEIRGALKQNMLDRGMSAYEIRTVIEAGADDVPDAAKNSAGLRAAKSGH
jgi:hypothetical protein